MVLQQKIDKIPTKGGRAQWKRYLNSCPRSGDFLHKSLNTFSEIFFDIISSKLDIKMLFGGDADNTQRKTRRSRRGTDTKTKEKAGGLLDWPKLKKYIDTTRGKFCVLVLNIQNIDFGGERIIPKGKQQGGEGHVITCYAYDDEKIYFMDTNKYQNKCPKYMLIEDFVNGVDDYDKALRSGEDPLQVGKKYLHITEVARICRK